MGTGPPGAGPSRIPSIRAVGTEESTPLRAAVAVLGPLELAVGGVAVPLPSRRERAVLAALAIRADRPVAREAVAEALWGAVLPEGWRQNLNVAVSRLRRRLENAAGDRARDLVETVPEGYRMRVGADELDAAVFERLVEQARRSVGAGQVNRADRDLDAAFSLWRGEPLIELAETAAGVAEISRLRELREVAVDLRHDVALHLGDHDLAISGLERVLEDDPLRERRWGQLMLALHRSGRQADALRAFQRARAALGELGLEPGPGLRQAEALVLGTAEAPAVHASWREPGPSGSTSLLPASRPPREPQWRSDWVARQLEVPLVGRRQELERLTGLWGAVDEHRAGGVALVEGDALVGKSRLVAEFVRHVGERGVWVGTARCSREGGLVGLAPASAAVGLLPPDLDISPGSPAAFDLGFEVAARVVQGAVHRPTVVVLDDAQWLDDQALHLFRELSDRPHPIKIPAAVLAVVVVRRGAAPSRVTADLLRILSRFADAAHVVVDPLAREEAEALLVERLGRHGPVPAGGVALALDAAAETPGHLVDLADDPGAREALTAGRVQVPTLVRAQVEERVADLAPEVAAVLGAAAVVGGAFTLAEAARGAALDVDATLDHLETATRARWLDEDPDAPGGYRFLVPLEHQALRERLSAGRRALVEERLAAR